MATGYSNERAEPDTLTFGGKPAESKTMVVKESFKSFNPDDLPLHFTFMSASPRGSGKTHALRHILTKIKSRFNHAYIFSETAPVQEDVYNFVPKEHLFDHFDESAMSQIFNKQKEIYERNKGLKEKDKIKNDILIVIDDCINSKEFQHSAVLKNLFTLGRHYHISVVILLQNLSSRDGASVILRKNADAFLTFSVYDNDTKEMISSTFGSIISKKDGMGLISQVTEERPYQGIVFMLRDRNGKKNIKTYSDYCYQYLAPSEPCADFFIGTKKQKKDTKHHYASLNGKDFAFHPSGHNKEVEFNTPTVSGVKPNRIRL